MVQVTCCGGNSRMDIWIRQWRWYWMLLNARGGGSLSWWIFDDSIEEGGRITSKLSAFTCDRRSPDD